jgi:hypothetical protein
MKKHFLKSSFCAGLISLLTIFPTVKENKLTDITKPYLGEYECEIAQFCNRDLLQDFSFIRLELKDDNTFILRCAYRDGRTRKEEGTYSYDSQKQEICLSMGKNGELKRKFPLKQGVIYIDVAFAGKSLHAQLKQK